MERLFPGVPGWWVAARLLALLVGTSLIAWYLSAPGLSPARAHWLFRPLRSGRPHPAAVSAPLVASWVALTAAALHAVASPFARDLHRWGEVGYLCLSLAPAFIVWVASLRWSALRPTRISLETVFFGALLVAWCGWRLFTVWENPRAASVVDAWQNHNYMTEAIIRGTNLLASMSQQGFGDVALLLTGADLLHPLRPPALQTVQAVGMVWIAIAAWAVTWSVGHLVSRRAGRLAGAAVLCSPLTMMLPYCAYPYSVMLPLPAILLALLVQIHRRRSVSALMLLGAVAGLTSTQGYIALCAPPAILAALWLATRQPRLPVLAYATAGLTYLAITVPFWSAFDLQSFRHEVGGETWPWSTLETVLHEQRDPFEPPTFRGLEHAGHPGPFDIALGGLLTPFAVPRTALRLWGDTVLEPWVAALTALGLLLCLLRVRQNGIYLAVVAAWLFPLLPTILTSDYDRASPLRNLALPVLSAPFAALAFEALCTSVRPPLGRLRVSVASVVLCAFSGAFIFEWINPRLLGSAATEIIIEASKTDRPQHRMAVLSLPEPDCCSNIPPYVLAWFPTTPLSTIDYKNRLSITAPNGEPTAGVMLWSPAMEQQCHISTGLCAQWPNAVIYTLYSRSRLTRAFAARIDPDSSWRPSLTAERWTAEPCSAFQPTFAGEPRRLFCDPGFVSSEELERKREQYMTDLERAENPAGASSK